MTTLSARKCPQCGAHPTEESSRFCSFCGAELPILKGSIGPSPAETARARFQALEADPTFRELMTPREPSQRADRTREEAAKPDIRWKAIGVALFSFTVILVAVQTRSPWVMAAMLPVLFAAWSAPGRGARHHRFDGPTTLVPALVVDDRVKVSGSAQTRTETHYFATLQTRDGHREEYSIDEWLAGRLAEGDIGVAVFRRRTLIDFDRIDV